MGSPVERQVRRREPFVRQPARLDQQRQRQAACTPSPPSGAAPVVARRRRHRRSDPRSPSRPTGDREGTDHSNGGRSGSSPTEQPFGQHHVAGSSHRLAHRLQRARVARQQVLHGRLAAGQQEIDADRRRALVVQIVDHLGQFRTEEQQRLVDLPQGSVIEGHDDHIGRWWAWARGTRNSRRTLDSPARETGTSVEDTNRQGRTPHQSPRHAVPASGIACARFHGRRHS